MSALLFFVHKQVSVFFFAIILAIGFSMPAQAVVINFDDLTYVPDNPEFPSFGDYPLGNEYRSQGLLIDNAYLLPYGEGDDIISWKNYLLAGASGSSMNLLFVGELPTFVGMYLGGSPVGILYANAYGPSGLVASHQKDSKGWEHVTFESATGIAQIEMWASQQHRVSGAMIDDLTYTYASVPEPSSLGLLVLAAVMLLYRRFSWLK